MKLRDTGLHGRGAAGSPVILVVEDEVLVRMAIAMDLIDAGYTVIEAAHAEEALAVLAGGHTVDLVFTDIHMPGPLDGIGLLGVIRRRFPTLPVILTSAHGTPPSGELGADLLFVAKPYLSATVLDLVAREIGREERNGAGAA